MILRDDPWTKSVLRLQITVLATSDADDSEADLASGPQQKTWLLVTRLLRVRSQDGWRKRYARLLNMPMWLKCCTNRRDDAILESETVCQALGAVETVFRRGGEDEVFGPCSPPVPRENSSRP